MAIYLSELGVGITNEPSSKTLKLHHQTDYKSAMVIAKSGFRLGGANCSCGPGIYFAVSEGDTYRKATRKGCIITANVKVGNSMILRRAVKLSAQALSQAGCDSILITQFNGYEYCAKDPSKVTFVSFKFVPEKKGGSVVLKGASGITLKGGSVTFNGGAINVLKGF